MSLLFYSHKWTTSNHSQTRYSEECFHGRSRDHDMLNEGITHSLNQAEGYGHNNEKLRTKPSKGPRAKYLRGIRSIKPPVFQWDAFSWVNPYIIECLSYEEINCTIPPFSLHTQSVERAVKLVTEASSKVEGAWHGHILSLLESRRIRPAVDTKCDYNVSQ